MQTHDYARAALWDTAIKFSLQFRAMTSPDHLVNFANTRVFWARGELAKRSAFWHYLINWLFSPCHNYLQTWSCGTTKDLLIGSLSKSLRLALIRLPEVNFPQNETLRMYGSDMAAGRKFPPKWDTAPVRRLHPAVAWNLTTWVEMFCHSDYYRRVYFASLALFNGHLGILRIPLDTISFELNLSQRLCQGCLS